MTAGNKIHLARPCIEDPRLFIAESSFGRGIDMEMACSILKELGVKEMRCSSRLGVARFRLDDRQVMIYRNGRIDVRRVLNVDDAAIAIDQVESMLENAFNT